MNRISRTLNERQNQCASLAFVCLAALLLFGCVRFKPEPLSASKTAAAFDARSLTNDALKSFLERNARPDVTNWPALSWNLDLLTYAAFYYQPSLEVAREDWRIAEGGIRTAAARPNPSVTFTPAYDPVPAPSPWIFPVTFDVPVETAGKRRRRMEQARFLSESARLNIATAVWQVRADVRNALLALTAARQRADLLRRQLSLQQEINERLQEQSRLGAIPPAEVIAGRIAADRSRGDLANAAIQTAEARTALAGAIGVPASALDAVDLECDLSRLPRSDELTTPEVRSRALRSRTDILAALADYSATQSALQVEIAKQYPDLHLGPGYAWNAGSAGENQWALGLTVDCRCWTETPGRSPRPGPAALQLPPGSSPCNRKSAAKLTRPSLFSTPPARMPPPCIRSLMRNPRKSKASKPSSTRARQTRSSCSARGWIHQRFACGSRSAAQAAQALGALEDAMQHPLSPAGESSNEKGEHP